MKNKKLFVAIIVIAFIIMVPIILGFMVKVITRIWDVKTNPESVQYTCEVEVEGYEISFMLPEGYQSSNHDTFDAFYKNEDSNFGVYGYRTEEMDDYQTKQSLYKEQNEMVMAKRDNAKVLEEEQITKDNITITKTVYSASKDGFLNYYYFYLVEFDEDPNKFAHVMVITLPEYAKANEQYFDEMIASGHIYNLPHS